MDKRHFLHTGCFFRKHGHGVFVPYPGSKTNHDSWAITHVGEAFLRHVGWCEQQFSALQAKFQAPMCQRVSVMRSDIVERLTGIDAGIVQYEYATFGVAIASTIIDAQPATPAAIGGALVGDESTTMFNLNPAVVIENQGFEKRAFHVGGIENGFRQLPVTLLGQCLNGRVLPGKEMIVAAEKASIAAGRMKSILFLLQHLNQSLPELGIRDTFDLYHWADKSTVTVHGEHFRLVMATP